MDHKGQNSTHCNPKEYSDRLKNAQSFVLMQTSISGSSAESQREKLRKFHQNKINLQAEKEKENQSNLQQKASPGPPTKPKPSNVSSIQQKLRQASAALLDLSDDIPLQERETVSRTPDKQKVIHRSSLPDREHHNSGSSAHSNQNNSHTPLSPTKSNSSMSNMTKDEMNTCLMDFFNRKSSLGQLSSNSKPEELANYTQNFNNYIKKFQCNSNISNSTPHTQVSNSPVNLNSSQKPIDFRPQNNSLPSNPIPSNSSKIVCSLQKSVEGPNTKVENSNQTRRPSQTNTSIVSTKSNISSFSQISSSSYNNYLPKVPPDPPKRTDSRPNVKNLVSNFDRKINLNSPSQIKQQLTHLQNRLLNENQLSGNAPSVPNRTHNISGPSQNTSSSNTSMTVPTAIPSPSNISDRSVSLGHGPAHMTQMLSSHHQKSIHKQTNSMSSNNTNSSSHSSNSNSLKRSSKQSSIASSINSGYNGGLVPHTYGKNSKGRAFLSSFANDNLKMCSRLIG